MKLESKLSTKDVFKLRNIIKEPWWPSSLSFEIGKIPPDLLKDQMIPEICHFPDKVCGIELAVFILSEVDAADKRATIREEAYNKYNKKNLYFVIADHIQVRDPLTIRATHSRRCSVVKSSWIPLEENQKTEIILNLESKIYQDILVVDVLEDANLNEIDRISAALSFYLKNCVSQSVIITTDDFKLADINWNFKPPIDKIHCTEVGFLTVDH